MTEYSHTMLVRGRYLIVALSDEAQFDPAEVTGYAVLSPTGERLRHDPSLEDARNWADRLIEEENAQRGDPPAPARAVKTGKPRR